MAGKSSRSGNWAPNSPATRYKASGKNREFYTFENAPGLGNYATGGTIIDGGDGYIYHIFTGDGTFNVPSNTPSTQLNSVDYLIVAGGGAGGAGISPGPTGRSAGGGGAGGVLVGYTTVSNAPGSYSITVGGGGSPNTVPNPSASRSGNTSSAFGLTAAGGGGGGGVVPTSPLIPVGGVGADGGSGGGGTNIGSPTGAVSGGLGNTPPTIPRQGYNGGDGVASPLGRYGGGGGGAGGAGGYLANGQPAGPPYQFYGYAGPGRIFPEFPVSIISKAIPTSVYPQWNNEVTPTGLAAGGRSYSFDPVTPDPIGPNIAAAANSGHGGSANAEASKGGGSGIVCIRYRKIQPYSRATGGTIEPNTHPEHPGVWRHIFTSPGNFTVTDPTLQWIDYLAVGGGGGGGGSPTIHGGGGGAGGFVSSIHTSTTTPTTIPEAYPWNPGYSVEVGEQYPVSVGTYPIGIGTGGNAATVGNDTTIGSPGPTQIIAYGGGAGATSPGAGGAGASGGGGAKPAPSVVPQPGGTATPTPLIQGNNGGITPATAPSTVGSGGGGSGATGSATGAGGIGWYSLLSPSAYGTPGPLTGQRYFAGGGGGRPTTTGGAGGGGAGSATVAGTPGTTNTGGGGGGGTAALGGTGGPGIVIIQYPE